MEDLDVRGPQVSHGNASSDPTDIGFNKYFNHPGIFKIKKYFNKPTECNFSEVTRNDNKKEINSLDSSKIV